MKGKLLTGFEILVESVICATVGYALSNMAFFFFTRPPYLLFSVSELYVFRRYWREIYRLSGNKWIASVLLAVCFAAYIGALYFTGYVSGVLVPFES